MITAPTRSPPDLLPALAKHLGVAVADVALDPGHSVPYRRKNRTTRRDTVLVSGRPALSVKWYPVNHPRAPQSIASVQTIIRERMGIRTPTVEALISTKTHTGIVEQWLGHFPTLETAVQSQMLSPAQSERIIHDIFDRLLSHPLTEPVTRERDIARCLEALQWLGDDTEEYLSMVEWVQTALPPIARQTYISHEDLIPRNIFIDEKLQPILTDFDLCDYSSIPWFAVWRTAHFTNTPRCFWLPEWKSVDQHRLFKLCSLLETQLQSEVLEGVRFVVDRDKGWMHHQFQLTRQLEEARENQRVLTESFREELAARIAQAQVEASRSLLAEMRANFEQVRQHLIHDYELRLAEKEQAAKAEVSRLDALLREKDRALEQLATAHEGELRAHDEQLRQLDQQLRARERRIENLVQLTRDTCPLVSIVVVNRDGRRFLPALLQGLENQSYPHHEVLFVDNGSTDDSLDLVRSRFPQVRIMAAGRNLGFAKANNLAVRQAAGEFVAFLNNDTVPDENWLTELVRAITRSPQIAAAGSKITFLTRFLEVRLRTTGYTPIDDGRSDDQRTLGVAVDGQSAISGSTYEKLIFARGFFDEESTDGRRFRWSAPEAVLLVPCPDDDQSSQTLELRLRGHGPDDQRTITVLLPDGTAHGFQLPPDFSTFQIPLSPDVLRRSVSVINNAASSLDENGNARDRGIFEVDRGQYDQSEEVTSLCGCSMLVRKDVFRRLGGFDEHFFMYFEDTDLCWRLRRAGYRLVYEPRSVVRHVHAGTSVEWSPFFRYHVARNHRLMKAKNLPFAILPREVLYQRRRFRTLQRAHGRRPEVNPARIEHLGPDEIEYLALKSSRLTYLTFLAKRLLPWT